MREIRRPVTREVDQDLTDLLTRPRRRDRRRRLTVAVMYEHHRAWQRLTELHDRAVGSRRWRPRVVAPELSQSRARLAHARAAGAALGSFGAADEPARQAMAESLAEYVTRIGSTRGIEGALLTGLTATMNSRLPAFDRLDEALRHLGFEPGLNAGAGGVGFLDVRSGSVGFVREDVLTESLGALDDVVGRPGAAPPPFLGGRRGKSNDPALAGMDPEVGKAMIVVTAWALASTAELANPFYWATAVATDADSSLHQWAVAALHEDHRRAIQDSMIAYFYPEDDEAPDDAEGDGGAGEEGEDRRPPPERGTDEEEGGEDDDIDWKNGGRIKDGDDDEEEDEETMPDPTKDDGAPVHDLTYVQTLIDIHSPRTVDAGAGRSFWVSGDLLVKPGDLVTDPPPDAVAWSLERPLDLEALLMRHKKPVNPRTGARTATPAAALAIEDLEPVPVVRGTEGEWRLVW